MAMTQKKNLYLNFLRTAASIVNRLCVSDILLYLKLLMLLNTLNGQIFYMQH